VHAQSRDMARDNAHTRDKRPWSSTQHHHCKATPPHEAPMCSAEVRREARGAVFVFAGQPGNLEAVSPHSLDPSPPPQHIMSASIEGLAVGPKAQRGHKTTKFDRKPKQSRRAGVRSLLSPCWACACSCPLSPVSLCVCTMRYRHRVRSRRCQLCTSGGVLSGFASRVPLVQMPPP
jgi:hypothetical protein